MRQIVKYVLSRKVEESFKNPGIRIQMRIVDFQNLNSSSFGKIFMNIR